MKNDDKKINELALAVFKRYHGYAPGDGGWTLERDTYQLNSYITPLVQAWEPLYKAGTLAYDSALNAAREIGIHDMPYVNEVRFAYQDVKKGVTHA